jgi:hypothetical protein
MTEHVDRDIALAWHDATCAAGEQCTARALHLPYQSSEEVRTARRFLERLAELEAN